jgi:hypothetical protein
MEIRDTEHLGKRLYPGKSLGLRKLTKREFNFDIQTGEHSSVRVSYLCIPSANTLAARRLKMQEPHWPYTGSTRISGRASFRLSNQRHRVRCQVEGQRRTPRASQSREEGKEPEVAGGFANPLPRSAPKTRAQHPDIHFVTGTVLQVSQYVPEDRSCDGSSCPIAATLPSRLHPIT